MSADLEIARVLSTRLCHDLAGPVSAVSAGIELMGDDPDMVDAESLGLLASSAFAAGQKLKFLRIAFGSMGKGAIENTALESAFAAYLEAVTGPSRSIAVTWLEGGPYDAVADFLGESAGQVIANLALLSFEATPGASSIEMGYANDSRRLTLISRIKEGSSATVRQDLIDAAGAGADLQLTPHNVQAYFAKKVIEDAGGALEMQASEGGLTLTVAMPG